MAAGPEVLAVQAARAGLAGPAAVQVEPAEPEWRLGPAELVGLVAVGLVAVGLVAVGLVARAGQATLAAAAAASKVWSSLPAVAEQRQAGQVPARKAMVQQAVP